MNTTLDFDIMGNNVIDHSVDHDVNYIRSRRPTEQAPKRLEDRDAPQTQLQIVEV